MELLNIEFDPLKLAAILAEKNVSQAELARKMGYTHRNIVSRIIAGRRGVTAAELMRFAVIFDKRPEHFCERAEKVVASG